MKCKYCQAELKDNSSVCPECGKDNLKDSLRGLKITALVLVCAVMLVLLAGLVCYGVTGSFVPWQDAGDETQATEPSEAKPTDVTILTADGEKVVKSDELDAYMQEVAATMGEHELKNSELQLYYWLIAYNTEGLDGTKPLTEQVYDKETGKTYHEYCLDEAFAAWKEIMVMSDAAAKADFKMPDAQKEYLDGLEAELESYVQMYAYYYGYDLKSVDELLQLMYGPGCTFEDYYNYCYNYYYGGAYWTEVADSFEVTDAELEAYFTENEETLKNDYSLSVTKDFGDLLDIRNIAVDLVVDSETKEEDWDATLAAAQKILDEYLAGDKTEDSFAALAVKHSADTATKDNGGLQVELYKTSKYLVDVRHILVMPEGGTTDSSGNTTYSEEEWAAAEKEAQKILDTWLAGDMTEESFGELANEHSDDNNGKVTNGGIYTNVYMGQMVKAFQNWCFDASRETGDYGIVKTEYGYHVMYFVRADKAVDDWMCSEDRQSSDVNLVKTDDGYEILYFVKGEPAWILYSRYGVQAEKAKEQLQGLKEAVEVTVDESKMVICQIG